MPESPSPAYQLLRESAGSFEPDWGLVELTGEDRLEWLQGQLTNDLRALTPGDSVVGCLCTPTGQLLTFVHVWVLEDRFVLGAPRAGIPALLKRCEEMVILEDVVATPLAFPIVSVQGPLVGTRLAELDLDARVRLFAHDWTGSGGFDLVLPADAPALIGAIREAFPPVDSATVDLARLEAGRPVLGVDTDARTLPPELGPHMEGLTISYKKGCYTGQEVLMRMHSRGHTNRTWRALVCESPVAAGAAVSAEQRADAGHVLRAGVSPRFGPIASAMLRREAAEVGNMVLVDAVRAEVRAMPLLGEDRD